MTTQPLQLKYRGVIYTPSPDMTPAPKTETYRGVQFTPVPTEHSIINVAECYRGVAFATVV